MKLTVTTFLLLGLGVLSVQAQTALTNAPPKNPWDTSASIGLTLTRGNSETLLIAGQIQAAKKWADKNELDLGVDGVYGESDSEKNAESLHGYAQYNRLFTERLFGYARVEGLYDGIADIDYRFMLSPGLGYYLLKRTNLFLRAEFGPGYVFEKVGGDQNDYATLRFAERGEWKITSRSKLWESVEYMPQIDRWGNYVLNSEIGLDTAITAHISQVTFLQHTYRSEPAEDRMHNDLKLVAGLKYKF